MALLQDDDTSSRICSRSFVWAVERTHVGALRRRSLVSGRCGPGALWNCSLQSRTAARRTVARLRHLTQAASVTDAILLCSEPGRICRMHRRACTKFFVDKVGGRTMVPRPSRGFSHQDKDEIIASVALIPTARDDFVAEHSPTGCAEKTLTLPY